MIKWSVRSEVPYLIPSALAVKVPTYIMKLSNKNDICLVVQTEYIRVYQRHPKLNISDHLK